MKQILARADRQDACILVGLAFLGLGAGLVYLPLGLIVVGAVLLALAAWRM